MIGLQFLFVYLNCTYFVMPCKVPNCKEIHSKHYCKVCKQDDASHFSSTCPRGTIIYHGTKQQYAQQILKNGFKQSPYGRIGAGVYFTKTFEQAKQIAKFKFQNSKPVVIQCIAEVDFRKFNPNDNEEVLVQKIDEWHHFCKKRANQGLHPSWANLNDFKEVCVKDPQTISFRRLHTV